MVQVRSPASTEQVTKSTWSRKIGYEKHQHSQSRRKADWMAQAVRGDWRSYDTSIRLWGRAETRQTEVEYSLDYELKGINSTVTSIE